MSSGAREAIAAVLTPDEQGRVYCGEGPITSRFEQEFAITSGTPHPVLGVNSCTSAIDLALHMIGVGVGDEVVVTPMTCSASNGSVVNRGASLVWADVDPITGLINPESVERLISPWTKAVIAVDWAGRTCDYVSLRNAISYKKKNIPIIEDAAHKLYLDEQYGDYVAWSFGPIKHLSCGGYGGALMTPPSQQDRGRLLKWHGLDRLSKSDFRCSQDIEEVGYRYHMTDDMASVGLANMELAKESVRQARSNAAYYVRELSAIDGIVIPPFSLQCDYWLFGLLVDERDAFAERMAERGIPTSRAHKRNDEHSGYKRATVHQDGNLIGTTYFDNHQINIPVGWWITNPEREYIVQSVKECVKSSILV